VAVPVAGGAGYIGGPMVLALLDAGEQVMSSAICQNGVAWAMPSGVAFVRGDVAALDIRGTVERTSLSVAVMVAAIQ